MSSEVQAKWMNSARRGDLGVAGEALPQEVLDRLHVVVGGGLDRLDALGVGEREAAATRFELRGASRREKGFTSANAGSAASAFSHSTSTARASGSARTR